MKLLIALLVSTLLACSSPGAMPEAGAAAQSPSTSAVRITGSDTMINLLEVWAERYRRVRPDVQVQVAGGGSGVGVVALAEGLTDLAAASREMTAEERRLIEAHVGTPVEVTVALDALAVYVHRANPLTSIALEDLARIYGDGGSIERWSQLSIANAACTRDKIIRVGRQNSSGTYAYFREVVLGRTRDYKLGSIDQSGSKDVVALVGRTPCAIGYSGLAYATADVKALSISGTTNRLAVAPTADAVTDGSYPLTRRLYLYTAGTPIGAVRALLDWISGPDGQRIVRDVGFVPVNAGGGGDEGS